jgi:hypothetical protein
LVSAAEPPAAQSADSSNDGDLRTRVQELERKLSILSQELEAERVGANAPAFAPVAPSINIPLPPLLGQYGLAPAASKVYGVKNGLSIGGYGEVLLSTYNQKLQDGTPAPRDSVTDVLRAVLYVGYKFTDWLVLNSEFEFEHAGIGDEHPQGEAIVEFVYLDFLLNKAINIRAGHLLIPVGFINEIHEPPTFLGAQRPAVERSILPTTWHENGVGIHGSLPGRLVYRVYGVNGLRAAGFNAEGIAGGRQDGHLALANRFAATGRLDWFPLPGALVGLSFYVGDSAQNGVSPIWTTLVEVHAEYRTRGLQIRALYAHMNNSPAGVAALALEDPAREVGTEQYGGYVEAGYDVLAPFPQLTHALIPFVRYELLNTQRRVVDGVTADLANAQSVVTVGANYKPIPQVAIKADYNFQTNAARTGQNQFNVAVSYLF